MATLNEVCDSQPAKLITSECIASEDFASFNRITMLAGRRHLIGRALCNRADPGAKVVAIPQRVEFDAEYRSRREGFCSNALLRHSCGAGHLHPPGHRFSIGGSQRLSIGSERNKMKLGVIGLCHEPGCDSSECKRLALIVHRK